MLEVHLRALEAQLVEKVTAPKVGLIDLWNNQTGNIELNKQIFPAVYVDFGRVPWKNEMSGIKKGTASITFHCANKNTRDTNHKAQDDDKRRLKRLDLSNAVANALEGFTAKDCAGNVIIKSMQLEATELDTNHDALTDDMITFSATLYYYDTWREKNWREVLIEEFPDERDETIVL
jgi:hypothetical protein